MNGGSAAQTLFFTVNSYDFYTQTKCTFWLHFGSILEPHVPKTIFFTMNFNDFRGVVFESQKWPKRSRRLVKMGQDSPVLVPDSTSHTSPFAQMIEKHLSMSNLQETIVSLSAINISARQEPTTNKKRTSTRVHDCTG